MDRTYVFNSDGNSGGGGSRIDIQSLLPGMMNRGIDPGMLALMNNNGFGGENGIWGVIYLAIICSIFGWNGNGGFGFGGRGNGIPAELAGNEGRELLMSAIQGNGNAIQQIASSLNCSMQQVQTALSSIQNSVGLTGTQIINAIQSGNSSVIAQIADCCCKTQNAITSMGYENQLAVCNQTNTLVNNANSNTLALRDGATANTNAILSKLDEMQNQAQQDKIASLTAQNTALQSEISQRNQNATILNAVGQQIAPLAAGLQSLQGTVCKIQESMPHTVPVVYPQLSVYNPEIARAAAYGAAAGNYAGGYCAYGANPGFWG